MSLFYFEYFYDIKKCIALYTTVFTSMYKKYILYKECHIIEAQLLYFKIWYRAHCFSFIPLTLCI